MGWGIGNDFNKATGAATPQYAAAANAQGQLDTAEQARIDAIRSGNMSGAGSIGKAYLDSPELQSSVKGFFGDTPTIAPTMGSGLAGGSDMAATALTDSITNEALGTVGGTALETGAAELGSNAATDGIMSEALGGLGGTAGVSALEGILSGDDAGTIAKDVALDAGQAALMTSLGLTGPVGWGVGALISALRA